MKLRKEGILDLMQIYCYLDYNEEIWKLLENEYDRWDYILEEENEKRKKCKSCNSVKESNCNGLILNFEIFDGKLSHTYFYCDVYSFERKMRLYTIALNQDIERFKDKELKNFIITNENRYAVNRVLKYLKEEEYKRGVGILFIGKVGTGKTHLAISIWKELLNRKIAGIYINTIDLFHILRSRIGNDSEISFEETLEVVKKSRFLAIDDLGVEKDTEFVNEVLFSIIDYRYEKKLPTIITTNLTLDEIKKNLTERIVSRMLGSCEVIFLNGRDFRINGKKEQKEGIQD
jgi:DNA replication protein DnaC